MKADLTQISTVVMTEHLKDLLIPMRVCAQSHTLAIYGDLQAM